MNWSLSGMDTALRGIKDRLVGLEFHDAHTGDAETLAQIAELVGLRVVREHELPDGERSCADDCRAPARIEAP